MHSPARDEFFRYEEAFGFFATEIDKAALELKELVPKYEKKHELCFFVRAASTMRTVRTIANKKKRS